MAKRDSIGYQADLLRKKGSRRIANLEKVIESENTPARMRNWAKEQVREIKSAMQGTRQYSTTGKRYKSKSKNYIKKQISRLESAIQKVAPSYNTSGDTFAVTQRELNRASVGAPSVYTKEDTKLFYRATQKIWQREGVGEHNRNYAILDHYNSIREENGLSPLTLEEIVDYVLQTNEFARAFLDVDPTKHMDDEQREQYEQAQKSDSSDADKKSPTDAVIMYTIIDSLDDLFAMPDPLDFDPADIMDI